MPTSQLLRELLVELARPLSRQEAAARVLEHGRAAAGGAGGAVYGLSDAGDALEALALSSEVPGALEHRRVPLDSPLPVAAAFREGRLRVVRRDEAGAGASPALQAELARLDAGRSWVCLPLRLGERPVGALVLALAAHRPFGAAERQAVEDVAAVGASALERARLEEARARAAARTAWLQTLSAALAEARTTQDVVRTAVRLGVEASGASAGALFLLEAGRGGLVQAEAHGDPQALRERSARIPLDEDGPMSGVLAARRARYFDSQEELAAHHPAPAAAASSGLGPCALALLPLGTVRGAVGVLSLRFAEDRRLAEDERAFLEALAAQCAQALERAQAHDAQVAARAEAEEAARRAEQLLAVATAVSGALTVVDVARTALAHALAAVRAPAGAVLRTEEGGAALQLLAEQGYPASTRQLRSALVERGAPLPVMEVLRTAAPVFLESEAALVGAHPGLGAAPDYLTLGTLAALPLAGARGLWGVLVVRAGTWRPLADGERRYMQGLADLCTQALERAQAYEEAREAVAVRDDFLAVAAHELRTPLTALLLKVQQVERKVPAGDPLHARMAPVGQQVRRLVRLVDGVLDVGRLAGGRLQLHREELDVAELVREVAERFTEEARASRTPLTVEAPAPVRAWVDRVRLEQVATNLLSNALKYGASAPVRVRVEAQGDALLRLVVQDGGIGIAPEDQQRLFQRFERAVSSRNFGGLGLGLWITRQLVEAHGGHVALESAPGQGATFSVSLPRA